MGRFRDLIKALATNDEVINNEENESIQTELQNFLRENGESQNRIFSL